MDEIRFGPVSVTPVVELESLLLDPLVLFPECTPKILRQEESWIAPRYYKPESGLISIASQSFLLRSEGRNILIDTCIGDCKQRLRPAYNQLNTGWLDRLRAVCRPEDVDIVLCTHMHVDHVGWNTVQRGGRWVPTFPNARYLLTAPDFEFYAGPGGWPTYERHGDYFLDSIRPVLDAGLVDVVTVDHRIDETLSLFPSPGHTLGHVSIRLVAPGIEAAFTGDLFHHPLQFKYPAWSTSACADPALSRLTREEFFARAAATQIVVLPAHFASPTACRIVREDDGYGFYYLRAGP